MEQIRCFEPIIFEDSRVLLIGTLPGKKSLETGFYYAGKSNYFWKFLSYYAGVPFPVTKQQKIELLKTTKVAVWDVYATGDRSESSKDKDIRNGILNDIPKFLREHPSIIKVGASGEHAYQIVKREFPSLEVICLPSTSGANGGQWGMKDKTRKGWVEWRKFVEE